MVRRSVCYELLTLVAIFVPCVLGRDYIVGDDKGWTTNFDYHAWAQGKLFLLGDSLIFKYKQGEDNVIKVNATAFQKCAPPADAPPLTTGNDVIQLKTAGKRWYICGVGLHCDAGQKLAITVLDQGATVPALSPSPSPFPPPLPTNATNPPPRPPPPAPSGATKAAVYSLVMMAFITVLAGIMTLA